MLNAHRGRHLTLCLLLAAAALLFPAGASDAQAQIVFRETFGTVDAQLPTATSTADGNWTSATCLNGRIVGPGGAPTDTSGATHFLLHFTHSADTGFPACTYTVGEAVWRNVAPIPVLPNTTYVFSYWSSLPNTVTKPVLTQMVTPNAGAITVHSTTTPDWPSAGPWIQRTVVFTTGAATTAVVLRINNGSTVGGGNDFGLDDISLTALPPPSCNIATNGSFESPNIQGDPNNPEAGTVYANGWAAFRPSAATMDGWQVVGGAVDILRYGVNASQGAQSIDLYGSAPPPAFQRTFTGLTPGQTYTFTVDYSGMETQASSSTVSLDQGGAGFQQLMTLRPVANAIANGNAGLPNTPQFTVTWSTFTYSFVATAAEATVMFDQTTPSPDGAGLFIDNFTLRGEDCEPLSCGSGGAQTISGNAQAWTVDSTVQAFGGNTPVLALNAPNGQGVQLYSAESNVLELDMATVVPAGETVLVYLANVANFPGPVLIDSSLDGSTWGAAVTHISPTTAPQFTAFSYTVPASGARYIRVIPQADVTGHTAVQVDALSYSFQYCECAGATNLVQQPSLEEFASCSLQTGPFGNWSPIQNDIHIWGPTCGLGWPVPDGQDSIDLDGTTTGGVQQTIAGLNPGQRYNLTFHMSFNPAGGALAASTRVQIGDFDQIYTSASNATASGFNRVYVEFTAQSATEVLRFNSLTGTANPNLLAGGGTPGFGVVVDDVRITTKYCDDFGDAPASFGNASHTGVGPQLGAVRDNEAASAPGPGATGDDAAGDDEDALQSITVYLGATTASAVVTALNPTASPATMAGWIDFNGNGAFDANERAEIAVPANTVAVTPFTLMWSGLTPIPLTVGTTTFARFRIATNAADVASPTGQTADGEVEDYTATVTALANLSIVKVALTSPVRASEPIVYELTVSNAGPSPATNVAVSDPLPAGTTFISASGSGWTCALNGVLVGCTTSSLGVGGSPVITVTVRAPNEPGPLTNVATVGGSEPDPDPNNTSTSTTTVEAVADLTISKVSTPNPYVPGDPLTYTMIVSNVGPSTVTGATVSDSLPAVLESPSWTCAPNTSGAACGTAGPVAGNVNTTVNLPPGGSVTILVTGTIASSATGVLTNTATVTEPAGVLDPTPGNNETTDVNNATIKADLRVSKTATPSPFVPGETLTYTIVASNAGPSDAVGARVQDTFPAAFAGFTWTCTPSTGTVCPTPDTGTGNIDVFVDLPAGESVTFTSTGTVPPSYVSSANNSVTITPPPDTEDPTPGNNTSTYNNPPDLIANLAITKTQAPDPYLAGSGLTYTLQVTNLGPSDVANARVQDLLPAGITNVSWTCAAPGTGASCASPSGLHYVDALVTLPAGTTATFTISGTVLSSTTGVLTNTATVTPPNNVTDPNPGSNEATANTAGAPKSDLAIVKTASPDPYTPGAPLTYTVVVRNNGPSDVLDARVQDLFPASLSGFTWTCAPSSGAATCGVPSGQSLIDVFVDLPAGSAVTFTATGTVPADATGAIANTATVTPPPGTTDPTPDNNSSTSGIGARAVADLSLTKTSAPNPYVDGAPITYTIVAMNAGPSVLIGGRVRDGLPAVLQNVTWTCAAVNGVCPAASGTGNLDALVDIEPGGTVTFTLAADVPAGTRGQLTNAATILPPAGTVDPTPNNNTAVDHNPSAPIPGPADLQITQEAPSVAPPNGLLTFRLVVRNLGSHPALNPYVTGMIPPGTTFVSATPSDGGTYLPPGNPPPPDPATGYPIAGSAAVAPLRATWPGLMNPGETHTLEFTVRVAPGTPTGQILWSCWWTWSETHDPYHPNNVVDAYLFVHDGVSPVGDLALQGATLTEGVIGTERPVRVGDAVPLRFWATNHGPAATRGQYALILDTANTISIVSVKVAQGWISPSGPASAVWDTGPVAPGQTVAVDLTVRLHTPSSVKLFAQRISGAPGDPNATNEHAEIVLDGYGPAGTAGRWVAVGDVDGAGAGEIVTGAGQGETPQVRVFTGTGADTLTRFFAYERPFAGGVRIASCDVNGDGRDEVITAPGPGRAATIRVLQVTGGVVTELTAFDAFEPGFLGGAYLACADLDADGSAELVVGAGPGRAAEVKVYTVGLSSLTERATFLAYESEFRGGVRVAAGAYPGRPGWLGAFAIATTPGPGRPAEVRLWEETGAPVAQVVISGATSGILPTLGDANGDGELDLVVSPDDGRPELIGIFKVDTGEVIGAVPGGLPAFPVGIRVALGVLQGGPGASEIVVGNGPGGHPRVRVVFWPPAGPVQRLEILPLEIP